MFWDRLAHAQLFYAESAMGDPVDSCELSLAALSLVDLKNAVQGWSQGCFLSQVLAVSGQQPGGAPQSPAQALENAAGKAVRRTRTPGFGQSVVLGSFSHFLGQFRAGKV